MAAAAERIMDMVREPVEICISMPVFSQNSEKARFMRLIRGIMRL